MLGMGLGVWGQGGNRRRGDRIRGMGSEGLKIRGAMLGGCQAVQLSPQSTTSLQPHSLPSICGSHR